MSDSQWLTPPEVARRHQGLFSDPKEYAQDRALVAKYGSRNNAKGQSLLAKAATDERTSDDDALKFARLYLRSNRGK